MRWVLVLRRRRARNWALGPRRQGSDVPVHMRISLPGPQGQQIHPLRREHRLDRERHTAYGLHHPHVTVVREPADHILHMFPGRDENLARQRRPPVQERHMVRVLIDQLVLVAGFSLQERADEAWPERVLVS